MQNAVEVGVDILKVTVKKDPNFGFHIMGGIDSGGNPFRPDDDGVFITYVAPGGAAEGLVQPGDKILMVRCVDCFSIFKIMIMFLVVSTSFFLRFSSHFVSFGNQNLKK